MKSIVITKFDKIDSLIHLYVFRPQESKHDIIKKMSFRVCVYKHFVFVNILNIIRDKEMHFLNWISHWLTNNESTKSILTPINQD